MKATVFRMRVKSGQAKLTGSRMGWGLSQMFDYKYLNALKYM
jgi:hypothetical protein